MNPIFSTFERGEPAKPTLRPSRQAFAIRTDANLCFGLPSCQVWSGRLRSQGFQPMACSSR